MRKIVLVNQKGGCGKTTAAINLASCLAGKGKRVLLVDLDPQGHAGLGLGMETGRIDKGIYEVLLSVAGVNEAVIGVSDNLHGIFSNVVLSAFEQIMSGQPEREYKLKLRLQELSDDYDYILIDSPPSVGLLTFNGLLAADEAIIPVDSSPFSLNGLGKLLETISLVEDQTGHRISYNILASNIDRRTSYGNTVVKSLRERYPGRVFSTILNTCTKLREAADRGRPISSYGKTSKAYSDFMNLADEVVTGCAPAGPECSENRDVEFTIEAPDDAIVQIAGDFTNWEPERLHFDEQRGNSPVWKKVIPLSPGVYQYKYLVDGNWVKDPANDNIARNCYGSSNSIINV